MKDFLPVFMSSWALVMLAVMNERLSAAERSGQGCSPPVNVCPPLFPFPSPSLQLWPREPSIRRQITFPTALPSSHVRLVLLSPCLRRDQIAGTKDVTRLLLLLRTPPPHGLFIYLERLEQNKKQVSYYSSHQRGSNAAGQCGLHDTETTWGIWNRDKGCFESAFNWPQWHKWRVHAPLPPSFTVSVECVCECVWGGSLASDTSSSDCVVRHQIHEQRRRHGWVMRLNLCLQSQS